jgi:hypothetical protein
MALSEALKRFMDDPYAPKVFGQSKQDPGPQLSPITPIPSEPSLCSTDQRVVSEPASSEQSTTPSSSPSPSILSRKGSETSDTSTAPSDVVESLVGDVATLSVGEHNHLLPCLLRDILRCPISFPGSERGSWISHSLSHYGQAPPPTHAICIFCSDVFDSSDPFTCWSGRMNHIAEHFEMNRTIEQSRPDFRVIEDMFNKGCISEEIYKLCFRYTERPPCDGLRPHDYIPDEHKKKQEAAYNKANRVIVKESRHDRRELAARTGRADPRKSKSKAIVK